MSWPKKPCKYTPEQLSKAISQWFEKQEGKTIDVKETKLRTGDNYTYNEEGIKHYRCPLTVEGLRADLAIAPGTWYGYKERAEYNEIITRAEDWIRRDQIEGAAAGIYNPNLVARLNGIAEKQEVKHEEVITAITFEESDKDI